MHTSICGLDCAQCQLRETCGGCAETDGRPFGSACVLASCCREKGLACCGGCTESPCGRKEKLIAAFNALGIADMPEVTSLNALKGSFINLTYTFPSGDTARFFDDDGIYLGCQLPKTGSDRCYGLAADASRLLVCEYGENGSDGELILYKTL